MRIVNSLFIGLFILGRGDLWLSGGFTKFALSVPFRGPMLFPFRDAGDSFTSVIPSKLSGMALGHA